MKIIAITDRLLDKFRRIKNAVVFKVKSSLWSVTVTVGDGVSFVQKVKFEGRGKINVGVGTQIGVNPSPYLSTSEIYIEARSDTSEVNIGRDVYINNNAVIIADKSKVFIGDGCLIGPNFTCLDSNFHSLNPNKRMNSNAYSCKETIIERNVFIGFGVTILRGSTIGENSVIGAGCVISGNIPPNSLVSASDTLSIKELRR